MVESNASKMYHQHCLSPAQLAILGLVGPGSRVLDMGCGVGLLAKHLTQDKRCRVTCVDINPEQVRLAAQHAESAIVGDITGDGIWSQLDQDYDCVTFADVLEHVAQPAALLERCRALLRKNSSVIASIPNVAYIKIRRDLLLGRFDYAPYGILDETHLRFFTQRTAKELFTGSGYVVEACIPIYRRSVYHILGQRFATLFAYQYVIKAVPVEP